MARLFCFINVLLVVMLLQVGIFSGARYRKDQNKKKEKLCAKYNKRFQRNKQILTYFIHYESNEALDLKEQIYSIEMKMKMLNREAGILHRIEFPSQADIEDEEVSGGLTGIPSMTYIVFKDTGNYSSCFVMKKNLETLMYMNRNINCLEDYKNEFSSDIAAMTEEHKFMKKVVKDMQQQLKESNNDV